MHRRGVLRVAAAGLTTGLIGGATTGLARAQSAAEEVWRFGTGGTNPAPTVAGGTVYAGDAGGSLYALDAADGTQQWRVELDNTIVYTPTVARGTVYAGTSKGDLLAVDAVDGTERWRFGTGGMIQEAPTVVGGTVYFGSDDTYLYAVDAGAGQQEWRFETSEATTGRAAGIESSPAVANGTVYVGSRDSNLYAVEASTGEEVWRFGAGDQFEGASPAVVDGTVYVVNLDENLYAIDAATGEEQWRFGVGRSADGLPAIADGTVHVGGGASNLYAVDAASGQEVWRFETSARRMYSPRLSNGVVYAPVADNSQVGGLYAFDAASGEQQWQFGTENSIEAAPGVGDGMVYVGTSGNRLYAVGAPAAEAPATATPTASPTQSGPVAGSVDGGEDGGSGTNEEEGANRVGDPGSTAFGPEDVPWTVVGGGIVVGAGALGLKLLGGSTGAETTAGTAGATSRPESDDDDDDDDETEVAVVQEVDPLSAASWATQPTMKRLEERYRDDIEVSYEPAPVRRFDDPGAARERWAAVAETTGMPVDPSFWDRDPPGSTELVNRAFAAAVEGDRGHRYVRALWRHAVAAGDPLDREALVDRAGEVGLDPERFRRALDTATVSTGGQRSALPFTVVEVDGVPVPETGRVEYADLVDTIGDEATEQSPRALPVFLADHGPVATAEVAAVYGIDRDEAVTRLEGLDDVTTTEVGGERFWTVD